MENWTLRPASMLNYKTEWVFSLVENDHPFNPSTIYAYKARNPKTGWEGWILVLYPYSCPESACANYIQTEANDKDILNTAKRLAELYDKYYYEDPIEFWDKAGDIDLYKLDPREIDDYIFEKPTPELVEKVLGTASRRTIKI